jgi:hypothetical protein
VRGHFDDGFPPGEQIPRIMEVKLWPEPGRHGETVRMTVNGLRVGDPLTDNGWAETGYRWHDTLHLAHAASLGWSPIFRGLAGLKRRSDPAVDHIEDGGRAAVADEAIAWAVFCRARENGWYENSGPDIALLNQVREMTYALEVSACGRDAWEQAIRDGIACLRQVWRHRGGVLRADLAAGTLVFISPLSVPPRSPSPRPGVPTSEGTGSRRGSASAGTPA